MACEGKYSSVSYVEDGKELAIPRSRTPVPATPVAPALATVASIIPVAAAAAAEPASSEPATSEPAAAAAALAEGEALVGRSSREPWSQASEP